MSCIFLGEFAGTLDTIGLAREASSVPEEISREVLLGELTRFESTPSVSSSVLREHLPPTPAGEAKCIDQVIYTGEEVPREHVLRI